MPDRKLRDLIRGQDLVSAPPGTPVREAARQMADRNVAAVLSVDGGSLLGIFTERDLLQRVVARGRDPEATTLAEVMTTEPVTLPGDATVLTALRAMREHDVRHMVVTGLDGGFGVVSIRDFLSVEIDEVERELEFRQRLWEEI